jgi:outer membrane protein OmpA-like peptidoglycan-associated protein
VKKIHSIVITLLIAIATHGQEPFLLKPITGINTPLDELGCGIFNGNMLIITNKEQDLLNDYAWSGHKVFHLESCERGNTFSEWTMRLSLFSRLQQNDEGTATYNPNDSILYFSSGNNYGRSMGKNLKIFQCKWNGQKWMEPEVLPFCNTTNDYIHPFYDPDLRLLVYSSNQKGGIGNMDIWLTYQAGKGWTESINPGIQVNSTGNEIFPTVYEENIFYSSNQPGGQGKYDIRKALRRDQWKTSISLGSPINSEADDLILLFLSDEKAMLTSNRKGGKGGDDIYLLERIVSEDEKQNFTALLEYKKNPLPGAKVTVTNFEKEIIINHTTDSTGKIPIQALRVSKQYKLQLSGIDKKWYPDCVLYILDQYGNRIKIIKFDSNGYAELELLPFSYRDRDLLSLEDNSLLNFSIQGQVYESIPGDIGRGEPITIIDDKGTPIALAYTNEAGKFKFTELSPKLNYTFQLSQESKAQQVVILDMGEKITLPILNAEALYRRVSKEEAIELINESNDTLYVSPKDVFVINRIYYDYKSSVLTTEAKTQLEKLAAMLAKSKDVQIELRSHTDSRGSDEFNSRLSQARADSAVEELINQGIDTSRLTGVGYGENALLNECDDGIVCSEPEHSINRRTEIKLTKVVKAD